MNSSRRTSFHRATCPPPNYWTSPIPTWPTERRTDEPAPRCRFDRVRRAPRRRPAPGTANNRPRDDGQLRRPTTEATAQPAADRARLDPGHAAAQGVRTLARHLRVAYG